MVFIFYRAEFNPVWFFTRLKYFFTNKCLKCGKTQVEWRPHNRSLLCLQLLVVNEEENKTIELDIEREFVVETKITCFVRRNRTILKNVDKKPQKYFTLDFLEYFYLRNQVTINLTIVTTSITMAVTNRPAK